MPTLVVIADDLTGALDSAVAFASDGHPVPVARRVDDLAPILRENPDIVAVNTGTRDVDPETVRDRMARLLEILDVAGVTTILKKVDSRLKGNVGLETAILADATGNRRIVVAPAIPAMGRVQRAGRVEGTGVAKPIEIARLFDRPVEVPDIVTDADLDRLVAGRRDVLWVGARGLAFALARASSGEPETKAPAPVGPLVVALGSRDPITLAQVAVVAQSVPVHPAPDGELRASPPMAPVLAIHLTDGGAGRTGEEAAGVFAAGIADWMRKYRPATLLASGGETANAILAQLGIGRLDLCAEMAEGVPVCEASAPWGSLRIMTKSGGFGGPEFLAEIARQHTLADMGTTE